MTLSAFHALAADEREYLARSPLTAGLPLAAVPDNWRESLVQFDLLERVWAARACFVCNRYGRCQHREPEFDAAEIGARNRGLTEAA